MIYTTLKRVQPHYVGKLGWQQLLANLGKKCADDESLALIDVLDSSGLSDALVCLQAEPQHSNLFRLLSVRYARRAQHLLKDQRSIRALDVAERHAIGKATTNELAVAVAEAWDVAGGAADISNGDESWRAAWVAKGDAPRNAPWRAAWAAAWAAAGGSPYITAWIAASAEVGGQVGGAKWVEVREAQATELRDALLRY
jgi:hypothetical protein